MSLQNVGNKCQISIETEMRLDASFISQQSLATQLPKSTGFHSFSCDLVA